MLCTAHAGGTSYQGWVLLGVDVAPSAATPGQNCNNTSTYTMADTCLLHTCRMLRGAVYGARSLIFSSRLGVEVAPSATPSSRAVLRTTRRMLFCVSASLQQQADHNSSKQSACQVARGRMECMHWWHHTHAQCHVHACMHSQHCFNAYTADNLGVTGNWPVMLRRSAEDRTRRQQSTENTRTGL